MKLILKIVVFSVVMIGCSPNFVKKNRNLKNEFDGLFKEISSDSLHVSTSGYKQDNHSKKWLGENIPLNLIKSYNIKPEGSIALGKIYFDAKKEIIGYLIGTTDEELIFLYIYSKGKKKAILNCTIASKTALYGAYEEISNSWFIDLDANGSLDFAIWKRLTDFEFPGEDSENISGDTKFIFYLIDGNFEYRYWTIDDLKNVTLTK